jgi:hypothetical protein
MRTALDADPATFDEYKASFVAEVRKSGWFQTCVFGDESGPAFSYTTGFWLKFNRPEVITFSLHPDVAQDAFSNMYRDLENGREFPVGAPVDKILRKLPVVLLPVPEWRFKDYLGGSRWFYGGDKFQCLQLVWPDRKGKFPWQVGFSSKLLKEQPDLTAANWSGLREH